ncbi:Maf family protein [Marinomonas algarum]|uniref:7-methyl-GTP pyrophosphatase n=1 Tax=Marinomonas algarum TaxID=2883105 RepID=A0A9X1LCV6_9GAMM|nr:Maf family protein [Marinomonas algarum]MCB5161847.1 Maf family nucleotide pyrophosphatase [Marinomonas algarum]
MSKKIILGSSSTYRKALLTRLFQAFDCVSPDIDESALPNETPIELVKRLTLAKAHAVDQIRRQTHKTDDAIIIASDQVAVLDSHILGKPHTEQNAIKQLQKFSGQHVTFLTGLCVLDQETMKNTYTLNEYHVYFRQLNDEEIRHYVAIEKPLDCAGSFKCEGLGVCLFEKMAGDDPNSLIGLPLISLSQQLREFGVNPIG